MEPERAKRLHAPGTLAAEPEVLADRNCLGSDPAKVGLDELLRVEPHELGREGRNERVRDPGLGEKLEAPLQRRQQLHAIPEDDPRMRVERDHRGLEARFERRPQDGAVPAVHAVERADRDGARPPVELRGCMRDPHRAGESRTVARRGSASSSGITRVSSDSSTPNGPISVRRRPRQ